MSIIKSLLAVLTLLGFGSCMSAPLPPLPPADSIVSPESISGNDGKYMSPFTEYGTVTEWVSKAKSAGAVSGVGSAVGQYLGGKALGQIPFIGGFIGRKAGKAIAKEAAISASGGWDFIRSSSDQSYDDLGNMAIHMYANYSAHEDYGAALEAAFSLYPDLQSKYYPSVAAAPRKAMSETGLALAGSSLGDSSLAGGAFLGGATLDMDQIAAMAGKDLSASLEDLDLTALASQSGPELLTTLAAGAGSLKGFARSLAMLEQMQPGYNRAINPAIFKEVKPEITSAFSTAYGRLGTALPGLVELAGDSDETLDQRVSASEITAADAEAARSLRPLSEEERHALGEMVAGYASMGSGR